MKILACILVVFLFGCGGIATKPTYERIELPVASKSAKKSITVSCEHSFDSSRGRFVRPCNYFEVFAEEFEKSGYFSKVFLVQIRPYESFIGPMQGASKSDLSVKIYSDMGYYQHHSIYQYWGLLHALSLGFIPMRMPNDFSYELTLYDNEGRELKLDTLTNKSGIWSWTPFILASDSISGMNFHEYQKDTFRNAIRHYLIQLEKSKITE